MEPRATKKPDPPYSVGGHVKEINPMRNLDEVRRQCAIFIDTMADNRPNCDDAGVARRILEELDRYRAITARTRERLFRWCDTEGSLYQRGKPIAQAICQGLYDQVLGRDSPPPTL